MIMTVSEAKIGVRNIIHLAKEPADVLASAIVDFLYGHTVVPDPDAGASTVVIRRRTAKVCKAAIMNAVLNNAIGTRSANPAFADLRTALGGKAEDGGE